MSIETVTQTPPPRRNWLRIGLMASLALNMLFVGAFAGKALRHGGPFGWRHEGGPHAGFFHRMDEPRRSELRQLLEGDRAEVERQREAVAKLRQGVRDLIVKDVFDAAAVEGAVGGVMAARMELRQAAARRFIAALSRMTPEERRSFMSRRGWRGGHGGERGDRGDF